MEHFDEINLHRHLFLTEIADHAPNILRIVLTAKFLNYVAAATIASEDYGGPCQHFGFVCEDHILDVACSSEPQINLIRASKRGALRAIPGGV